MLFYLSLSIIDVHCTYRSNARLHFTLKFVFIFVRSYTPGNSKYISMEEAFPSSKKQFLINL